MTKSPQRFKSEQRVFSLRKKRAREQLKKVKRLRGIKRRLENKIRVVTDRMSALEKSGRLDDTHRCRKGTNRQMLSELIARLNSRVKRIEVELRFHNAGEI